MKILLISSIFTACANTHKKREGDKEPYTLVHPEKLDYIDSSKKEKKKKKKRKKQICCNKEKIFGVPGIVKKCCNTMPKWHAGDQYRNLYFHKLRLGNVVWSMTG